MSGDMNGGSGHPSGHRSAPERFEVTRRGTPDPPTSAYFVLDVVHDFPARVALRSLVGYYRTAGRAQSADELERFLNDSAPAATARAQAANETLAGAKKTASKSKSATVSRRSTPMS